MKRTGWIAALCLVASCGTAIAADTAPARSDQAPAAAPMPDNEPMHTGMMKKGMTVGDVRKAAMQRKAKMDEMMKQEAAKMGQEKSAP